MPPDAIELPELDLSQPRRVHIVGVGGAGMSAIARLLVGMGHRVSGSDLRDSAVLARLEAAGVEVAVGQRAEHVPVGADAVVYSTAVPLDNVELVAARALGVPVLHRARVLRALTQIRRSIAVAGSHGKTTTASMLALVLRAAGLHPSFVIGADVNEVGSNAAYDSGDLFVVEADESDGTFLALDPAIAVVTNVEPDHLDHYGDVGGLADAFAQFARLAREVCVIGVDDPGAAALRSEVGDVRTFGFSADADYHLSDYVGGRDGCRARIRVDGVDAGVLQLPVAGRHNALNAAAALAVASELGVEIDAAQRALAGFGGVARRFQHRGELDGVALIDDYAHLPAEVEAAIATAREGGWNRVVVVFQPHRYTRTAALWREFRDAFSGADAVVVTDVYAAGERPVAGVSGRLIVQAVLDAHPDLPVTYVPRRDDLRDVPRRLARRGDVVLTLGAGDLTTLPDEWLTREAAS
ncbi:MAG TPA: UDP-N-acetylmuramate--L-alanine ligase [Acidimicrobiia bacterium]|nr:UDP-N-acetylmuramate--L-alanine ligase [Acidimicrobiia bacterium]